MKIDYGERYYNWQTSSPYWIRSNNIVYTIVREPVSHSDSHYQNVYYVVYTTKYTSSNVYVFFGWYNKAFLIGNIWVNGSYNITIPSRFRSSKTGAIFQSNEGIGLETLNKLNKEHRVPSIINNELLALRNKRKELIS